MIIHGITMSQGELVSNGYALPEQFHTLYLSKENEVSFTLDDFLIYQAISGNWMLIENGKIQEVEGDENVINNPHPRSVIGIMEDKQTMLWVVVDGRQLEISEGMTMAELTEFLLNIEVYHALNLDGGGSSTLVMEDENGVPIQLNTPVDQDVVGQERPVANHLGIYASRLDD